MEVDKAANDQDDSTLVDGCRLQDPIEATSISKKYNNVPLTSNGNTPLEALDSKASHADQQEHEHHEDEQHARDWNVNHRKLMRYRNK